MTDQPQEFSVMRQSDGRVVLYLEPYVADALRDLLEEWNYELVERGMNRDSGWADVAAAMRAVSDDPRRVECEVCEDAGCSRCGQGE